MKFRLLSQEELENVNNYLVKAFSIEDVKGIFLSTGTQKIRYYSGSTSLDKIKDLNKTINIQGIGLYTLATYKERVRIANDGVHLFKDKIKKNIIDFDENQIKKWMHGDDFDMKFPKGHYIIMHDGDIISSAVSKGDILVNFVPKERRIKIKD